MILAALALAAATPLPPRNSERKGEGAQVAAIDDLIRKANLAGEVLVARGDRILLDRAYGTVAPAGGPPHQVGARWRLASITKQVVAALFLKSMETDAAKLDDPYDSFGPVTWRMLLTHHSGLPNPDDTPKDAAGVPAFYNQPTPLALGTCTDRPGKADSPFSYNNCDYVVLGMALMGPAMLFNPQGWRKWPAGMTLARPGEVGVPGYIGGKPEPRFRLENFSTSGALTGTARNLFRFDRQLLTGKLLKPAALAELWKPEGGRSYQALGQWVFPGKLAGCAAPKRIVQRDGEIFGVQTRNFIFPDDDLVVIAFTNRGSDDFKFGEVWEGKGFTYDLLSAAACETAAN